MVLARRGWPPLLLVFGALAAGGCASQEYVQEHPVSQAIPALKHGVYAAKSVDVKPVPTHEVEPDYPPELGSILTGKATVVFTVRPDGKVTDASVVAADDVLFGESALHAVGKWRFQPALLAGAPVACRLVMPFVFTSPYGYLPGGELPADLPPVRPPANPAVGTVTPSSR